MSTHRYVAMLSLGLLAVSLPAPALAASLYVTSDTALDPMATTCTLGAPCHIEDAIRIAEGNSANDMVILVGPSTFIGTGYFTYYPDVSDLDHDFGIRVDGGAGLFDGNGGVLAFSMHSRHGNLSASGLELRNSEADYREHPAYLPPWNSVLNFDSDSGDILVDDVTIWNNERRQTGTEPAIAGIRARTLTGNVEVTNSLFLDNTPGALRADAERVTLTGNSFLANPVVHHGLSAQGAVQIAATTVDIENNNFSGNECAGPGYAAGLSVVFAADIPAGPVDSRVIDNQFLNNSGDRCSGGLYLDGSRNTISNTFFTRIEVDGNQFARNRATDAPGAGIHALMKRRTRLLLRNNIIYDNETLNGPASGSTSGSAIYATTYNDAQLHLINNTITGNPLATASVYGAAVDLTAGSLDSRIDVYNNIIWDNPTTVHDQVDSDLFIEGDINASTTVRNNDYFASSIFGGSSSTSLDVANNLSSLPGFVSAGSDDFHLLASSNLIDMGSIQPVNLPTIDMDGQNRVQSISVDIGADEFSGVARRQVTLTKLGSGDGSVSSFPSALNCGVGCSTRSADFDDGSTVSFLALADGSSVFIGWGGDCGGSNAGTQFVVSQPTHSCTAEFQPIRHRIVINAAGPQSGSIGSTFGPALNWLYPVGGTQRVVEDIPPGTDVTINGMVTDPLTGHVFLDDCEAQGGVVSGQASGTASCSFSNVQQDHAMRINFNNGVVLFPGRTLNISKSGLGDGTVVSTPGGIDCGATCSQDFFFNTEVKLVATPDAQSIFNGWSGDCPAGSGSVVIIMDVAKTCDAEFIPANSVTIALGGSGSGNLNDIYRAVGTQYPQWANQYSARYPDAAGLQFQFNGNDSTVTIIGCDDAGQGMLLVGDGSSNASCSIGSLTQNVNLSVTYTRIQSVLTVNASGSGSGVVNSSQGGIGFSYPTVNSGQSTPITHGDSVTISVAGTGGSTAHWTGCTGTGASIIGEGTDNSSCIVSIYAAKTVDVEFRMGVPPGSVLFRDGFE